MKGRTTAPVRAAAEDMLGIIAVSRLAITSMSAADISARVRRLEQLLLDIARENLSVKPPLGTGRALAAAP
jgi:hypothetical protein